MNERIQQLAEQAEEEAYVEYAKKETGYNLQQLFMNKFAELIVRECAKRLGELGNPELSQGLLKHLELKNEHSN